MRGLRAGLCLLVVLHALGAWAQDEGEEGGCSVIRPEDGGVAELLPYGTTLTRRECSAKWCVGTSLYNMGWGHSLSCLYVTDTAGVPTGTTVLGNDVVGLKVVRFVAANVVEVSYATNDGASSELYDISEQGQVALRRPQRTAEQLREEERARKEREAADARERARREELEAHSSCDELESESPQCHGEEPSEAVKASIAQVCHVPKDSVQGVCSKTGCMGFARPESKDSKRHEVCVVWAPKGKPPVVLPYSWGELRKLVLDGSRVCLSMARECTVSPGAAGEECADVSGPVARWVHGPPEGANGSGDYDVLPYKGEAPVIDGNARELEWKAPTLRLREAALVSEGLEAWGGPKDASAEWIVRSRGEQLLFLLRVYDDQVVASEKPEQDDAVSLSFSRDGQRLSEVRFVLAPKGKVTTPGATHARCAWSKLADGYRMECAVPLAELVLARPPAKWGVHVEVEDRDGPGKQLKRLASSDLFLAWTGFPPSWNEATQLHSWTPCLEDEN